MPSDAVIAVLNELLVAERRNLAPRLCESILFVSRQTATARELVEGMARLSRDHCESLAALIRELGAEPGLRGPDMATADLHFQALCHALPRLLSAHKALLGTYRIASLKVSEEPRAADVLARIMERHTSDLQALEKVTADAATDSP